MDNQNVYTPWITQIKTFYRNDIYHNMIVILNPRLHRNINLTINEDFWSEINTK